ncbi:MAG: RsmD family RNA methyltransferase [Opitutales bacterium]
MRITGGKARSIPIQTPKGSATRPATDQMRERVFSSLGEALVGARCLDLFAGTGAYGLEALSRGAAEVTFVEKHRGTAEIIRKNIGAVLKAMDERPDTQVLAQDVLSLKIPEDAFDLIFIDPPYPILSNIAPDVLEKTAAWAESGLAIWELPAEATLSHPKWTPVKRLGKGKGQSPTALILQAVSGPYIA